MKVQIKKMNEYDLPLLKAYFTELFKEHDLWRKLRNKKKILLKPNLLGAFEPEKAVTTHPIFMEAIIQILLEREKEVLVGDSNGGTTSIQKVYDKTGMANLAERYPIKLINFSEVGIEERSHNGYTFPVSKAFLEADAVISISKYKTHGMMRFTGAVKNLYGVIPGLKKSEYHKLNPETDKFAALVTNLYQSLKDRIVLHIMDGIIGMEGEGPAAGSPRRFGVIFSSENGTALDYVAASMMGFDWRKVPIIWQSLHEEGILPSRIEVAPEWQNFVFPEVKLGIVSFSSRMMNRIPSFGKKFIRKQLEFYPDFNEQCRLCQVCVKSCPVQAITYTKGYKHPVIDYSKCIKCLCCHELCPYHAVYIHKSPLAKMFIH
ncbi:MAG TPA: DUF362 domain-containing protein [Candidatus Cloacimonadota bacterium]|nr:DUF362 domain-containing protein [Candidatus Cloacimonadota bacterium]HPT71268.1 DUF362 domain-containing protein [Candidatus Cloacimonadota bacterium]